jgi:hypothetical protein
MLQQMSLFRLRFRFILFLLLPVGCNYLDSIESMNSENPILTPERDSEFKSPEHQVYFDLDLNPKDSRQFYRLHFPLDLRSHPEDSSLFEFMPRPKRALQFEPLALRAYVPMAEC